MRCLSTKHGDTVLLSRSQAKKLADLLEPFVAGYPTKLHASEALGVPSYVVTSLLKRTSLTRIPRPWLDVVGQAVGVDTKGWE